MKKNNIFLILIMMLVTSSCQTLKNAVSGAKQENSDEFLVQKKHPLVLPPNFDDLPVPFDKTLAATEVQIKEDIEKLLGMENDTISRSKTSGSDSIESFVLKKIKEN
jgi:hypothetical protein